MLDYIEFVHNTITFRLTASDDTDLHPSTNGDCYSAEDINAFDAGTWQYVVVQLVPYIDGIDHDDTGFHWTLGSVEFGKLADIREITMGTLANRARDEGWCDEALEPVRQHAALIAGQTDRYFTLVSLDQAA